ncbi:Gamma-glutamyl ligase family protein [Chlamydia ibidis]|uniref:Gamma-glutamyl ligase family protein n=2 Tax=Chlamydia ibidis TaxID=1405396 RepID=S7J3L6_9CHLA|nr:putative folate metabolism gamma-glutamate ligase [Chlamydia ibidis]EPP34793.1 Gamma-glutamyl ligase family protein [Chlamydia ibidis]EQM62874.1 Gamma-glutamyl ligase family protein [Chlamydia ibidis 10-1398/6]
MQILPVSTPKIRPYDDLSSILVNALPRLEEKSIVVITSKIISLCEGAIADPHTITKDDLVKREAEAFIYCERYAMYLTKKHGVLLPSAGIDESNAEGYYVLYPRDILKSVNTLGMWLKEHYGVHDLGVIISDSHTTPMRRGVLGLGLCWHGFHPLYSYVGKPDCFGRPLQMTHINLLDALATSAVLCMGEGNEQTPLAIIQNAPKVTFHNQMTSQEDYLALCIGGEEDLYGPILHATTWETLH